MLRWLRKIFRRDKVVGTTTYFRRNEKYEGLSRMQVKAAVCSKASHDIQIRPLFEAEND